MQTVIYTINTTQEIEDRLKINLPREINNILVTVQLTIISVPTSSQKLSNKQNVISPRGEMIFIILPHHENTTMGNRHKIELL